MLTPWSSPHPLVIPTQCSLLYSFVIMKQTQCWSITPPPPPIIRDGIPEYEIERILDSRVFRERLEYLVCWKGYGAADVQWVPARDVSGAMRLVAEFHKQNPEAPQHISATLYATLPFQPLQNFTKPPIRGLFDWTKGRDLTCDPRLQKKGCQT